LALALLGVVAGEAILFEDRGDVVDETDRLVGLRALGAGWGRVAEEEEQRQGRGEEGAQPAEVQTRHRGGTPGGVGTRLIIQGAAAAGKARFLVLPLAA